MPPQSKKQRKVIPAAIISDLDQPQDYVDPIKKLAFNPGQTTAERVVAAAGKRPAVRPKARVSKVARRLADQPRFSLDQSQLTTLEDRELADARAGFAAANAEDEREREARRFEELTTVPDITLSASGAILPGSGAVLSSMMRYGYQGLNNSLALTGQVLQDAFGSDDMPTVLGGLGQALSNIAKESAPTFENYDIARPVKERGALDRTVGFLTQLGIQLPLMAVATKLLGPTAGFGVYKAESLHAAGEQDPATLAGAFVQGAAEGVLLSALGKTANVIRKTPRTGPVVDRLKKSPVAAQAGAQLVGGMAQTGVDGMLHPGQPAPDWLDYLHGGVANVIMDPVVLGGNGRARKATQAATRMSGELDPSSYNLDLPPDNLAALRRDFWQPQDLPWDNRVTVGLLNKARVQLVDNPADPEGVLYLNPQAAAVIDRASQAVLPGSKIMSGVAQGMSLPARDVGLVAEHLLEKAAQFMETIKQLPDGDPKLNDLATGAVVFESLAEHLQAATADGQRSAALRVLNKQKAADPANPVARAFDQTVTGHESIHVQTDKIAKEMGVDPRATVSPGWLADHPIGAKVILGIGDSKSPLQGYDPVEWTNEAIAYAAQPGPDPGLGLTKQERGVLVGDYFAAVMDKHGPGVMEQVWVGRMDREVAQVAFKRLYESNRVRYARDPVSGKRLGLEWRGVEVPKFPERIPDNGYGLNRQSSLINKKAYVAFTDEATRSTAEASLMDDASMYGVPGEVYYFNRLKSNKPGQGGGTKVLRELLEHSNKTGVPILNEVNAYGNLSQEELVGYYKKHGFVPVGEEFGDDLLIYRPVTADRQFNQQPDPDYDAANPAGEAAAEVAGKLELDPDITHLRKTNAPPEISQQVAAQREAERKAYREVANLRARLKRNNDLAAAATKMQQDAGLPQPELDAEIQQLGTELKQQHVAAVKKFRELRSRGNVLKGELAGQLGDNTARKRAEAKLAAKGRLANGDQLPPIDAPLDQVRMSNEYGNFLANVAKDMLIASDVPLLDSSEMSTTDQLINAMRTGRTTVPQLDEVAKRYGLKDTVELFERFRQFGSAAGRDLNIFARLQREINKLRGLSPELDDWINSRPPTMQEIDAIANGPNVWRQLVNLRIGAMIANLSTQTPNVLTGALNATGVRSLINLTDQVLERAARTSREVTRIGEPSKFEQNAIPPLSSVLAPIFAASTATKDILNNPYWFAHGKLKDGTLNDPADRPAEKSIRIAQELHNFQPELMRKFDSQLSDDVIQIHLLPHADAVQAERDALTLLKNQVTNMPAGADKFEKLAAIKRAEKRLAKTDRWLPKQLHEASRGLHKYLTLARMGERLIRTISLVSNLETEAARYGLDLTKLDEAQELYKLPAAVIETAVDRALSDTYASRPDPATDLGRAYKNYATSNNPGWILSSAVFPFVGYMGNYARMVFDYSPLPLIKAALVGAGESGPTVENHQKLIKAALGTAVYIATVAMVEDKYDEAERTGKPVGPWHEVGGVSARMVPQLVVPLYVADYVARTRRELASPDADSALEFFNILTGLDTRNLTGTFKWLDDLISAGKDATGNKLLKAEEAAATAFSDWFASYLTPLNMYHDIGAQYWKEMRDVKDLYGMGAGSLYAPILNKLPVARELLSDKIDPFTGMPVHRTEYPAVKAITGFTVLPEQSYPARIFQHAGIKLTDWIPFTGVTEVDRDLVAAVGRLVAENTPAMEAALAGQDLDAQIPLVYEVMSRLATQAEKQIKPRHPGVYQQLKDARETNRWRRRLDDKLRELGGVPSRAEQYKEMNDRAREVLLPQ